jgi:hypothetical protein
MTTTTTAARTTKTFTPDEVRQLLRDAAFVLRMTRKVKTDILRDAARPSSPAAPKGADRTPAALGV